MDFLLFLAVSVDNFCAAVACGLCGIRIPLRSCGAIAGVSCGCFALSALLRELLCAGLPSYVPNILGCLVLCALGGLQLTNLDLSAAILRTKHPLLYPIRRMAALLSNACRADSDGNRVLSVGEAVFLAMPLSVDALFSGIGVRASGVALLPELAAGFALGLAAIYLGSRFCAKVSLPGEKTRSRLCGLILLALGLLRLC